jgi:hypothetical protein
MSAFRGNSRTHERPQTGNEQGQPTKQQLDGLAADLKPAIFVRSVANETAKRFGEDRPDLQVMPRGHLAKFWFGPDARIHYELWIHERAAQLEIGLHFEADPATNRQLYHAFDKCLLEIEDKLGTAILLEEWDHGWARLYEIWPLYPLDEPRVQMVSHRIQEFILVVEPIFQQVSS